VFVYPPSGDPHQPVAEQPGWDQDPGLANYSLASVTWFLEAVSNNGKLC
jgi:hypothetical protein